MTDVTGGLAPMTDQTTGKPLPPGVAAQVERVKEQALIVLMRRIMRARGRSTGQCAVTVRELEEANAFRLVMSMEEGRFLFDLARRKA